MKNWKYPLASIIVIGSIILISFLYKESWGFNWDGIRNEVADSVKSLEASSVILQELDTHKEYSGSANTNWLTQNATISELETLTDFPNPAVMAKAYEGLIKKTSGSTRLKWIKEALEREIDPIYVSDGHLGIQIPFDEYLISHVLRINLPSHPPISEEASNPLQLTEEEIKHITELFE